MEVPNYHLTLLLSVFVTAPSDIVEDHVKPHTKTNHTGIKVTQSCMGWYEAQSI